MQPEVEGPDKKSNSLLVIILQSLLLVVEITVPLFAINRYGYPDDTVDVPKETHSSIDNSHKETEPQTQQTQQAIEVTVRSAMGIEEIMADKHFSVLFGKYMGREFQMEIFMFFDALRNLGQRFGDEGRPSHEAIKDDLNRIIEEFFLDDGINKLKISKIVRKKIIRDYKRSNNDLSKLQNIFQPAIDDLKLQLAFHLKKFNENTQ